VWLDAGGTRIGQPRGSNTDFGRDRTAASFGGGFWHGRGALSVAGEGSVTKADSSLSAVQLVLRASLAPSRLSWSVTDIDVSGTSLGLALPGPDGNRGGTVRQHVRWRALDVYGSAGAGRTLRFGLDARGHAVGFGVEAQRPAPVGQLRARVHAERGVTDDYVLMEHGGFVLSREASAYTVNDVTAEVGWQSARLFVSGARSWRRGVQATRGTASGHALVAGWQFAPSAAVVLHAGMQLADVVRGVPQARYAGAVLRWTPLRTRVWRGTPSGRYGASVSDGVANGAVLPVVRRDEVELTRDAAGGALALRIEADADAVVEVACSTHEWAPQRAVREGDRFVHRITLPSGAHKVAVRINGGDWRAPRGLAVVRDDFGMTAGIVVVP
jgi:hypothetical protein